MMFQIKQYWQSICLSFIVMLCNFVHANTRAEVTQSVTPKRIVVLEFSLLDDLNQLGLKPVGVGTSGFLYEGADPDYLESIIAKTPSVGAREAPNLEAIASLKPDLIIGDIDFNQAIHEQLEKIAPTILLKGIFGLPEQQIENLKIIAEKTNTMPHVPSIVANYQKQFSVAQKLAKKGGDSNVLIGFPTANNSFNALAHNSITSQILDEFGKHNMITENTSSQLYELSVEGLLRKNPDQIVILLTGNDRSAFVNFQKNPLWQHLTAVKNHKVYFADRNIWGKSHGLEALTLMYQEGIQTGFLGNIPTKENIAHK
ncbi:iron-siderophore ABC transporter substrate-binding protein [Legionella longbeachae]|uniref:Putative periplasmic binding protein n=2 Tax=Legionella longbeachae TaxID=450 RepID=D3HK29_LEGLN|nr:iron-siderophore ABC transporter substrate-binding protein [Legionella longbeachae]HBD7399162.1 iron-siderophore ABC transporter substrate-binding protein [Legionella pneumophila]ARB93792.1 iron-siderophore ABC transporter substrate-binding protein [Legionella longbeachae]ARM33068.1 iron-siderophore ABC transporter substrate-binding protein [Legionella longbeachae]EEZ94098.1 putative ferrichrome ABC transporter [Legionella longbeachae D-4968]QIN33027.1 ABC transporter substrate-binding prot